MSTIDRFPKKYIKYSDNDMFEIDGIKYERNKPMTYDIEEDIKKAVKLIQSISLIITSTRRGGDNGLRNTDEIVRTILKSFSPYKELKEAKKRINKLEKRLEITHFWTMEGKRKPVNPEDRDDTPDGIYCRDVTIDLLDDQLEKARQTIRTLKEQLEEQLNGENGIGVRDRIIQELKEEIVDLEYVLNKKQQTEPKAPHWMPDIGVE